LGKNKKHAIAQGMMKDRIRFEHDTHKRRRDRTGEDIKSLVRPLNCRGGGMGTENNFLPRDRASTVYDDQSPVHFNNAMEDIFGVVVVGRDKHAGDDIIHSINIIMKKKYARRTQ
jgi:hypothetical protein